MAVTCIYGKGGRSPAGAPDPARPQTPNLQLLDTHLGQQRGKEGSSMELRAVCTALGGSDAE